MFPADEMQVWQAPRPIPSVCTTNLKNQKSPRCCVVGAVKMSYERSGSYRIREKFVRDGKLVPRKRSIFDKVNEIKRDLNAIIPEIQGAELLKMLSRCHRYYYGTLGHRRSTPAEKEKKRELTFN